MCTASVSGFAFLLPGSIFSQTAGEGEVSVVTENPSVRKRPRRKTRVGTKLKAGGPAEDSEKEGASAVVWRSENALYRITCH